MEQINDKSITIGNRRTNYFDGSHSKLFESVGSWFEFQFTELQIGHLTRAVVRTEVQITWDWHNAVDESCRRSSCVYLSRFPWRRKNVDQTTGISSRWISKTEWTKCGCPMTTKALSISVQWYLLTVPISVRQSVISFWRSDRSSPLPVTKTIQLTAIKSRFVRWRQWRVILAKFYLSIRMGNILWTTRRYHMTIEYWLAHLRLWLPFNSSVVRVVPWSVHLVWCISPD